MAVQFDALPVGVFGAVGTKVSLLDVLKQAYGDQATSIGNVQIAYRGDDYFTHNSDGTAKNANQVFSYWDPNNPSVSSVSLNGTDIGVSTASSFNLKTVNVSDFANTMITVGNNVMPNIYVEVTWQNASGMTTAQQELNITTVASTVDSATLEATRQTHAGAPTAQDIVAAAEHVASVENGVANPNDCHFIASQIATLAGATFDPTTETAVDSGMKDASGNIIWNQTPDANEEGGFWRIAYRGSDHPVANWQTEVQAGDIVRMGWTNGGFHTTTVVSGLNADGHHPGMIQVVDNADTGGTIGEHWVDYGSITIANQTTIYRLAADHMYLIDGSKESASITMTGTVNNDRMIAGDGGDTLNAGAGNDDLLGGNGNDTMHGGEGNDRLNGGRGADWMAGGSGNDVYVVDNAGDTVTEQTLRFDHITHRPIMRDSGGIDEVRTFLNNYSIDPHDNSHIKGNVENLSFFGTGNFVGHGNGLANDISGGNGNDQLFGMDGNDRLFGGFGDDTLDGGTGADTMRGGGGNDTYIVDNANDIVDETSVIRGHRFDAGGIDTVKTTLDTYSLENHKEIENLTYTGTGNFEGHGNAKDNVLQGGLGNDRLDGGAGADTMMGGRGNDTYVVDNVNDVVSELGPDATVIHMPIGPDIRIPGDMGGIDTVETTLSSFALNAASSNSTLAWIENLTFTGTGNFEGHGNALDNVLRGGDGDDHLFGMEGKDTLFGGKGNDVLNGGEGADTMVGGKGNDTYYVENAGDVVQEGSIIGSSDGSGHWGDSGGIDEVRTTLSSYSLSSSNAATAGFKGVIENLTFNGTGNFEGHGNGVDNVITGGAGDDRLFGNAGADTLFGGAGNDHLFGGTGKDVLTGGTGADHLTGGAGTDKFVFALGDNGVTAKTADHILDFARGETLDVSSFVATHHTIEATRDFHGNIAEALSFANSQLAAHTENGSAVLVDSSSHNVYVFMDQNGDHKFESAVVLDHADALKSDLHTEIANHQLFV